MKIKKLRLTAFIVTLALVVTGCELMVHFAGGNFGGIVDIPSLAAFLLIVLPLFFLSGHTKNFLTVLRIIFTSEKADSSEFQKASASCSFFCRILFLAALLTSLIDFVGLFMDFDNKDILGASLALALIPFAYAIIPSLFLLTLKAMIDNE